MWQRTAWGLFKNIDSRRLPVPSWVVGLCVAPESALSANTLAPSDTGSLRTARGETATCTDRGTVAGVMVTGSRNEQAGRGCGTAFSPTSSSLGRESWGPQRGRTGLKSSSGLAAPWERLWSGSEKDSEESSCSLYFVGLTRAAALFVRPSC